ncbi:hypothetical protein B566_EDAN001737 [Ephemera danica]|nr:hypothetical protein B566_EDAN001737 [Ephemera danica]
MALWARLMTSADVLLRVPPLFIMDELLRMDLGLPQDENFSKQDDDNQLYFSNQDSMLLENVLFTMVKFILSCLGCLSALCVFMLPKKYLTVVYKYLFSVAIMFVSYWTNVSTIKEVILNMESEGENKGCILHSLLSLDLQTLLDWNGAAFAVVQNYIVQFTLGIVFLEIHLGPRNWFVQHLIVPSFMAPSLLALLPVPSFVLHHAPVFAALLPLGIIKVVLWFSAVQVIETVIGGYQYAREFATTFGLTALLENEWIRLNVPSVLRTFWLLRVAEHAIAVATKCVLTQETCASTTFVDLPRELLVSGCETQTAVLGMTSIVSYICHYIGSFFQWILLTEDEDDRSIGTVSAILFFILALQTGLTGLEPEKRFIRLCRNFCLLFTALLHFIHNIVNPLLMSLSASHNPATHRHVRALAVCAFLVIFPTGLLFYLWSQHAMSTWLLAVSAFSVEVIVKVAVSLMIYSLFLIDAYRSSFWETLDDYVYYIRAFGNTVEFCFGIFLFFNGAWILVFESGGAIRAIMMCIHAYFNIWCEARAGWSVFIKRRTAVKKINSLPEATSAQLAKLDDVCAICYQEMSSAKITRCRHFFHGDRCPLCHEILHLVEDENESYEEGEGDIDEDYDVDAAIINDALPQAPIENAEDEWYMPDERRFMFEDDM